MPLNIKEINVSKLLVPGVFVGATGEQTRQALAFFGGLLLLSVSVAYLKEPHVLDLTPVVSRQCGQQSWEQRHTHLGHVNRDRVFERDW